MLSFEFFLWLSASLKLHFLKSAENLEVPGPPRGMKLGNAAS